MVSALLELAARVEAAPVNRKDRTLNREVALAVGWARLTPSESRKSYPTWYHPSDVRDGHPVFDSLHGTEVWREPLNYLGSVDDALTLCRGPADRHFMAMGNNRDGYEVHVGSSIARAATLSLSIVAAALRAKAVGEGVE